MQTHTCLHTHTLPVCPHFVFSQPPESSWPEYLSAFNELKSSGCQYSVIKCNKTNIPGWFESCKGSSWESQRAGWETPALLCDVPSPHSITVPTPTPLPLSTQTTTLLGEKPHLEYNWRDPGAYGRLLRFWLKDLVLFGWWLNGECLIPSHLPGQHVHHNVHQIWEFCFSCWWFSFPIFK